MSVVGYLRGLGRAMRGHAGDVPGEVARDPAADFWYGSAVDILSAAGIAVTADNALRVPAVFGCLRTISNPIASLPLVVFRRETSTDGTTKGKTPLPDHPVAQLFKRSANDQETGALFRGQMQWNLGLRNNALAEIVRNADEEVAQLKRLAPGSVVVRPSPAGDPVYTVTDRQTGRQRTLYADQVFHLKGMPLAEDGLSGMPMTENGAGRDVIGAALALQLFASAFFKNDTRAGGVIKFPGSFKSEPEREAFKKAWREANTGANAFKDKILEFGGDYVAVEIDAQKSQMNETRKQLAIECAQLWKVPPHKIGILDRATFSNIEQQSIEFVTDTMLVWFVLWEAQIKRDLILEDDVFCEFNVNALLRGDIKSRYEAYAIGRNWGWLSANDVLELENRNGIGPAGDRYLEPKNMAAGTGQRAPTPQDQQQTDGPPADAEGDGGTAN